MNIGAVTTAYNEATIIKGTINCLKPFVNKHVILLSEKPYYKDEGIPDNTFQICIDEGVDVIKGVWREEHVQRNLGRILLNNYDWILWFDADEMMTKNDMEILIKILEDCKENAVAIVSKVYWKTTDYRFHPYPTHHKIIATRPEVEFIDKACINVPYKLIEKDNEYGIIHHHLSYAEPKDILSKVLNYGHSNEFDGQKWYNEHFKDWQPGQDVIQPFGTKWTAVYDPLPQELKELL